MKKPSVLFAIPPGFDVLRAHHEATSGMGALVQGVRPFLYPPQVVATCAAATRDAGMPTAVFDGAALGIYNTATAALQSILRGVVEIEPDVVAVLVSEGTAAADENFLRMLRKPGSARREKRVLLLGPSAHFVAGPWLEAGLADAALSGEPEGAISEAVCALAAREAAGSMAAHALRPDIYESTGLLTGQAPHAAATPGSSAVGLDALPFPAWDLCSWQAYDMLSMLTSRGCPAGCAYCAYTVAQGQRFRSQSPERTIEEVAWLVGTFGPQRVQVRDPVFVHDRARVEAVCQGLMQRKLTLDLACESRPEHFDDDLLGMLAAIGASTVKIGLESGDPALLVRVGRAIDPGCAERGIAETIRVARTCRKLGITCQVFVMAGLPGQNAESLRTTEALLRRLPHETQVRAKLYCEHPGALPAARSAEVSEETLTRLAAANRPESLLGTVRRVYAEVRARARKPADSRASQIDEAKGVWANPAAGMLAGQRAFLTGGNGFVGGHVARALAAAGCQVYALVRPASPLGTLADLPVEIVPGDLTQPSLWMDALRNCTLCFHVAALYGSNDRAAEMYASNASATAALFAACVASGVRRVVYTGTVGTVGRVPHSRVFPDESVPFKLWEHSSAYVRSKFLGELIALSWIEQGLEVIVVKPSAPVGAGDFRPTATGRRILAALRGEATPYPPEGINHVPVSDVAAGHLLAALAGRSGRTYILGHCEGNLDHRAFLRLVGEAAGVAPLTPPSRSPAGGQLPSGLTANPARAIGELGMPQSDLRAAFAESVAWYRGRAGAVLS